MSGPGWGNNRSGADRAAETDAAIVARARHDPRAFAPLYECYLDPVFRYCYRRLGNREAAEDATGQVFARALAALPRFEPAGDQSVRAWLFAIARNVVVDGYRSGAAGSAAPLPLDAASSLIAGEPGPEEAALRAETGRDLRAVLGRLPPEQREIVELRLAGLTGPEIARTVGKRHGAVKTAQFRAFARLRAMLVEEQAMSQPPSSKETTDAQPRRA